MSVPIYQEGNQCGTLQDTVQGLYTRFTGRLKVHGLCRVYGVYPEGEISLGVPVPEGDSLRVRAMLPTSRLPKGKLLSGRVVYELDAWRPFSGGCMGGVIYPAGQRKGNCLRFPWKNGLELPAMEVFCFYRLVREKGTDYLELCLDAEGYPVMPE